MAVFTALLAGFVFGVGLLISGMANPAKVLGFLDLAGPWDPSLAFVAFLLAGRRTVSLIGLEMKLPTANHIDRRLVVGSTIFGIGWGVAGFCPGPALVALGMGEAKALAFVIAMLLGMVLFELIERRRGAMPARVA
jgi:uncharacterized membrane protein YedE/YeeE